MPSIWPVVKLVSPIRVRRKLSLNKFGILIIENFSIKPNSFGVRHKFLQVGERKGWINQQKPQLHSPENVNANARLQIIPTLPEYKIGRNQMIGLDRLLFRAYQCGGTSGLFTLITVSVDTSVAPLCSNF